MELATKIVKWVKFRRRILSEEVRKKKVWEFSSSKLEEGSKEGQKSKM